MVKPIKASEVIQAKLQTIPNEVLEAFNELIVKNFDGYQSTIKQNEAISLIIAKTRSEESSMNDWYPEKIKKHIYDNHWLDIEDIYRKEGWLVEFDKCGFNETYESFWTFTKK